MNMNLIDRAIAVLSPAQALRRVHARAQLQTVERMSGVMFDAQSAGWQGGSGRDQGSARFWHPIARDARSDTLSTLTGDRAKSRELARTSPIACGAINTNVDRVVGTGLALSAQPNRHILGWTVEQAQEWKRTVQAEFSLFADSAESDQAQTLNFYENQGLVLRAVLESGDCFTLLPDGQRTSTQPYALRLQVLEADRVGNPLGQFDTTDTAAGVRFDALGAPAAYHVYDRHPGAGYVGGSSSTLYKGQWVDRLGHSGRRRILHHYRKLRPDMPRGAPYLAPIVYCIHQITRYTEAEIEAAVVSSLFTAFIEMPPEKDTGKTRTSNALGGAPVQEKIDHNQVELGIGHIQFVNPDEKITFADPSRPNPNFESFVAGVMTQIGMALGIPRELLIKQFNASYSASKAALLDAWVYFRSVRTWLARSFCQPVFETWLAEAVATGRISAPGFFTDPLMRWAYTRAAWHGDSMGSINPKDEVAAYTAAVDARLMTLERAEWELFGSDFNETFDTKQAEFAQLKAAGMAPVPKAGAAAPQQPDPSTPGTPA